MAGAGKLWRDSRWLQRRIPAARQVRLGARSIFIRPSAAGWLFAAGWLALLLVAINYRNSLAYALCFLLLSLALVAILHTWRNLAGIELAAGEAPPVFAGERALLRVRLQSGGRAHHGIELGWPPALLLRADVPAAGNAEIELSLATVRRGWLAAPRLRVETRFPLGLWVAWSWVDLQLAVLVYPAPLAGEWQAALGGGEEGGRALARDGVDDFQGLRPYQPGDSRRRLHWKAWSRGQGLLVKDFAALRGDDPWLDFEVLDGEREARLSLLCHGVLQLAARGKTFGLRLPGVSRAPGTASVEQCLRDLALFERGATERAS